MTSWTRAAATAALLICTIPLTALAQDVELRSLDGSVELEGTLLAYDGAYYRIDTIYGPLTIASEGVACAGPGCPDLSTFVAEARIAGEATLTEDLLPQLIAGFGESRHMTVTVTVGDDDLQIYALTRADGSTAARFTVRPGTSDSGFLDLLNSDADIALTLRPPTDVEQAASEAVAPDDPPLARRVRVLALDALVPIVSPENPLDSLSLPDIARLFAGEVSRWSDMGGADAPIALHLLAPGLGVSQTFETRIMIGTDLALSPNVIRHDTAADLAAAVAHDAYAIGITTQSASGEARALAISGPCGFSQVATPNSVKAEDYPLTAPVFVHFAPRRLPQLVREFLVFFETDTSEHMVRAAGFVDQTITRTSVALQGARLANAITSAGDEITLEDLQALIARVDGAERLSPTFRFAGGATDLDTQSRASIARLAAAIERGAFDGRRLIFVGFSDGDGAAAVNLRLSQRRAETVRNAVLAATDAAAPDRVELIVDAFGEAMPMACDDTEWGRAVNRRVEVWLE